MRMDRGLVFWGTALVAAGSVALLIQSAAIPGEGARDVWRFWPVALIAAGVAVIAARTAFALPATILAGLVVGGLAGTLVAGWPAGANLGCSGEPTDRTARSGSFSGSAAEIELRFNCGGLTVRTESGTDWSVEARHGPGEEPRLASDASGMRLTSEDGGGIPFGRARGEWEVSLPADVELDLDVRANASDARLDLRDASLSRLALDTNAGDVRVMLDGASVELLRLSMNAGSMKVTADDRTGLTGELGMNAGSLELCAPEDAAIEIVLDDPNITFSHNLDDRGFSESGDTWTLGGGAPAIRLAVDGNAASFTFNPSGGCE